MNESSNYCTPLPVLGTVWFLNILAITRLIVSSCGFNLLLVTNTVECLFKYLLVICIATFF